MTKITSSPPLDAAIHHIVTPVPVDLEDAAHQRLRSLRLPQGSRAQPCGLHTVSSSRGRRPWRSIVDQAQPWIAALRSQ